MMPLINFMNQSFNTAANIYLDIDQFVSCLSHRDSLCVEVKVKPIMHDLAPWFRLEANQQVLFNNYLHAGTNHFEFNIPVIQETMTIVLGMRHKQPNDTLVDNHGLIIGDRAIVLESLQFDKFDILGDYDFFQRYLVYTNHDTNTNEDPKSGWWNNADLICEFVAPWMTWYNERSTKNFTLDSTLQYKGSTDRDQLMQEIFDSLQTLKV